MTRASSLFPGGLRGGQYKPLDAQAINRIHKASMAVFENTGIRVLSARALKAFKDAGAEVDLSKKIVRADEAWIMSRLKTAPGCVTLYGRDERHNLVLDGYKVYMGTGGTALNVLDLASGQRRPTLLSDVQMAARLVDALENIHFFVLPCYPNELDRDKVDVNRFYAGLRGTEKHVMGGVYTADGVRRVAEMAAMIAGGRDALLRKPFVSFITCIMSPLLMDAHYTDLMLDVIETGLPLATPTAPMSGATAPATLAGTLVQMNVEALSGVLLAQIVHPGHPVLYSCVPVTMDLRTSAFCFGSVEMGLMNAASAQLSRFYNLPNYTTAGINEAKIPDVQSGYESMSSTLLCALAGCNYIHDAAGLIESGMTIAYEQYVIDNEILGMCMRAVHGIEISEETLAIDVISGIGEEGHYLTSDHTIQHMRSEFFYPEVSDRQNWSRWQTDGSLDGRERARRIAVRLLKSHKIAPIEAETDILRQIPGMVDNWDV